MPKKILFKPEPPKDEEGNLDYYEDQSRREAFQGFLDSLVWTQIEKFLDSKSSQAWAVLKALGSEPDRIRFYQGYVQALEDLKDYLYSQADLSKPKKGETL